MPSMKTSSHEFTAPTSAPFSTRWVFNLVRSSSESTAPASRYWQLVIRFIRQGPTRNMLGTPIVYSRDGFSLHRLSSWDMTGCGSPDGKPAPFAKIGPSTVRIQSIVEYVVDGSLSEESGTIIAPPFIPSAAVVGPPIPARVTTPNELLVCLFASGWWTEALLVGGWVQGIAYARLVDHFTVRKEAERDLPALYHWICLCHMAQWAYLLPILTNVIYLEIDTRPS